MLSYLVFLKKRNIEHALIFVICHTMLLSGGRGCYVWKELFVSKWVIMYIFYIFTIRQRARVIYEQIVNEGTAELTIAHGQRGQVV